MSLTRNWRKSEERYNLQGNICKTCNTSFFPPKAVCPECRRKGKLEEEKMPRSGKIVSFTKVVVGPKGFENEAPYHLALIKLENGATILSQIVDSSEDKIKIGAKVKKVFRKISDTDEKGVIAYGYKFKVAN